MSIEKTKDNIKCKSNFYKRVNIMDIVLEVVLGVIIIAFAIWCI